MTAMAAALQATAQNPFVQTWFTSDPAPMVHDGTMYVYTGHDEDNADFFWMQEWRVYSTKDMVNWQITVHPSPWRVFLGPTTVRGLHKPSSATVSSIGISVPTAVCHAVWPSA